MSDAMRSIRLPLAATIAAGLLAPACQVGILDNRDDTWRAPPGKLKEVSEQDLVGRSGKPPVSPEEATREALEGKRRLAEYDAMQDLSLVEVRAATLENNLELRTLLYDPAIAAKTLDAERAKFEMSLYGNFTNSGSNFLTDLALGNTVDQNNATAGLDIPLATGGDLKAFTTFQQFASGTPDFLDPDGDWQAGLGRCCAGRESRATPRASAWRTTRARSRTPAPSSRRSASLPSPTRRTGTCTGRSASSRCGRPSTTSRSRCATRRSGGSTRARWPRSR
jgi:hypothetical protein